MVPVLKGVESGRDALNPPVSTLVGIEDELDGGLHLQLLLQGEQVLLPRTPTLGEQQQLPAGVHLRAQTSSQADIIEINPRNFLCTSSFRRRHSQAKVFEGAARRDAFAPSWPCGTKAPSTRCHESRTGSAARRCTAIREPSPFQTSGVFHRLRQKQRPSDTLGVYALFS